MSNHDRSNHDRRIMSENPGVYIAMKSAVIILIINKVEFSFNVRQCNKRTYRRLEIKVIC